MTDLSRQETREAREALEKAYKLANDKNLAASQVFYAVAEAKDALDRLAARVDTLSGPTEAALRAADILAAKVDALVRRGLIGSRSEAADALLDYRDCRAVLASGVPADEETT